MAKSSMKSTVSIGTMIRRVAGSEKIDNGCGPRATNSTRIPAVPARFSRGSIAGMSSAMAPSIAGPRRWMAAAISASVKSALWATAGPTASTAATTPAASRRNTSRHRGDRGCT